MLFSSEAFAQTVAQAAQRPSLLEQLFFPFVVVVFFYFVLIRPQTKRQKQHRELVENLKRGDAVMTSSGILGRIDAITDRFVTPDVGDGVRLKVLKSFVTGLTEEKNT